MKKHKKTKKLKLELNGWSTTDAEEIERRIIRAKTENFRVENIYPSEKYFSTFLVTSRKKHYRVEIRSLSDHINSCDCPDYQNNQLGTCKHIEHILWRLQKWGKKIFKKIALAASPLIEIYFNIKNNAIQFYVPTNSHHSIIKLFDSFFSSDGTLIGNPIAGYSALKNIIIENKQKLKNSLRVSTHLDYYLQYQEQIERRKLAKTIFLKDVALGKRTIQIMKYNLYPYQQEGMMHLAFNERALLADEMGLGKTIQAIAACQLLKHHQHINRVLVVATASLKAEWEEQIAKFSDLEALIIQGPRANRLRQYQQASFFYLTNYEQIVMDHDDIQRILSPDVVILDEAQRIKNWQTKTANTIKQLKSRYAFVLTGTPIENRIDDLYSIMQFLDPHIFGSLFRFNRDFYELDEKGKPIGYKNLDTLHQRIRPIMLRRLKSDVEAQLPNKTVNNYFVSMHPEQRTRYQEYEARVAKLMKAAKHRPLRKEEMNRLQNYLACMRMICDTPFILDQDCRISPKLTELNVILEELLMDQTTKIIVFSEWERMLQLVRDSIAGNDFEYAWHTGSVPQHKRRLDINRFKNDPNCRLFLSTDSGSVGLNLQSANVVINLDLPWNPAKLEQRIARAWRKHQTRSVQVINLVCENSIEHRMLSLLSQKQTMAQGVLEGKDNLKSMKLPSGRAAFIERMESLMAQDEVIHQSNTDVVKSHPVIPDEINLLQSYHHPDTSQKTIFAVADKISNEAQTKLHQSFMHESVALEIIDRKTFDIIQRLEKAGIIKFNQPSEIFHTAPDLLELNKKIHEERLLHAKKYFSESKRKHKMADVLAQSDFQEEALYPLKEAMHNTLHSFSNFVGKIEKNNDTLFSSDFIKEKLIKTHHFPDHACELFANLHDAKNIKIENLLAQHQKLIDHVQLCLG